MSEYIDPFTDFGFKYLFGQEDSKEFLIDFLNDLLEGERVITDLSFMDKEQTPDSPNNRICIYDIYCTTDTGEHIIVEMQNKKQKNFKDRALFYMCEAIVSQGKKGEDWPYEYEAVYGIFFMNFPFPDSNKFRTDVILADKETGEQFSNKITQIFLCLKKFDTVKDDCKTGLDKWIYVLKKLPMLTTMPFEEQKAIFAKLKKRAATAALTDDEREKYNYSLKIARDNLAVMEQARIDGEELGRAEGLAKGLAEGLAKGLTEGRAEGRAEAKAEAEEKRIQEKIANAKAFKKVGVGNSEIASILGLPLEMVEAL